VLEAALDPTPPGPPAPPLPAAAAAAAPSGPCGVLFVTMLRNAAVFGLGMGKLDGPPYAPPKLGVNPLPGVNPVLNVDGS